MKRTIRLSGKEAQKQPDSGAGTTQKSVTYLTISPEEEGQRIDNFLFRICKGVPKSHIYRVLRSGEVRVNKGRIDQTYRLVAGDMVRLPPLQIAEKPAQHVPGGNFRILYEDSHLLIIDKPSGIAVHGGSGIAYGVIEQLRAARPDEKFLELMRLHSRPSANRAMYLLS